jgi:hypothetical protein
MSFGVDTRMEMKSWDGENNATETVQALHPNEFPDGDAFELAKLGKKQVLKV